MLAWGRLRVANLNIVKNELKKRRNIEDMVGISRPI
jgi:hypothetical protein